MGKDLNPALVSNSSNVAKLTSLVIMATRQSTATLFLDMRRSQYDKCDPKTDGCFIFRQQAIALPAR
ncbi:MAG: hypothetical protein F6J93_11210 [Oscillatoria sp. SIO1A7]|nr:hypothetical protein [Oscillatoria sp. SIO1A7]